MNKRDFYNQFRSLLPDTFSETPIDLDDVETSTLLFAGSIISKMSDEAQKFHLKHFRKEFRAVMPMLINEYTY